MINHLRRLISVAVLSACCSMAHAQAPAELTPETVKETMRTATEFMVDKVSYRGGYLWAYLPDFSRMWGELEARRTQIWIQPPGTATMGHLFLDAYRATGDEYYYQVAEQVAGALIWAQHPSGGWHYFADFGGEASIRDWYATIGKNAWRLEEFHHYYGNATFDDNGTIEAGKFLLRLYMEKLDPTYRPPLDKVIQFVLDSQYPIGGWPQRYPLSHEFSKGGKPDYTSYITLNDEVAEENIDFLLMTYQALGEQRVLEPVRRAMNTILVLQQGQPQPGWAMQYTLDLKPAHARSYEPKSLAPAYTADMVRQLIKNYRMTGETKFLARIPEALDWLDSVRLPEREIRDGRTHPTFVEIGTGKPLYVHRRGSNAVNGEYYVDYKRGDTLSHYRPTRFVDVEGVRRLYEETLALAPEEVTRDSPLKATGQVDLPAYFTLGPVSASDRNLRDLGESRGELGQQAARLIRELNTEGYWPTPLSHTSNPYQGPAPEQVTRGNFASTDVGDRWDTSPYRADKPVMGISTGAYIRNMGVLIRYLIDNPPD